jgi:hypothetical protein
VERDLLFPVDRSLCPLLLFILPKLFFFAITYQLRGREDFDSELEADKKKKDAWCYIMAALRVLQDFFSYEIIRLVNSFTNPRKCVSLHIRVLYIKLLRRFY